MPLKIEGEKMSSFFDGIVSEISRVKKIESQIIQIQSILSENQDGYVIKSFLTIPKGIYSHNELSIEEHAFDKLPGYFSLNFECEGKLTQIGSFTKTSDGKISSIGLENVSLSANIVGKEWSLVYSSGDLQIQFKTEIAKFFEITGNDPLIFTETYGKWIFKGAAPSKIKEENCRLLFKDSLFGIKNGLFEKIGETKSGLTLYEVGSDCIVFDIENQTEFAIKLNQDSESYKILEFAHAKLPNAGYFNFLEENRNSFIGLPKIFLFDKNLGLKERFRGTMEIYNENGQWKKVELDQNFYGRRRFRFRDKIENVIGLKTFCILPEDFSIEVLASQQIVKLYSTLGFRVYLERGGFDAEIERVGNEREIKIDSNNQDSSKTHFKIRIEFAANNSIDLKLPNPGLFEVFVDAQDKIINRETYALSNVHGLSVTVNNFKGVSERKTYLLKLVDIHERDLGSIGIKKEVFIDPFTSKRIPIYQWMPLINQLFSLTHNTRASVRICSSRQHHYIDISKYDLNLGFDGSTGLIASDIYELKLDLNLCAFNLETPFNSNEVVDISLDDENRNILGKLRSDGRWFIYSKANSSKSIFPFVILKGDTLNRKDDSPIKYLWEASFFDYNSRNQRFIEFFDDLYLDFKHEVWKELYDLYKSTEHLPISALDVWKGLVKSPKGMLTFLFSNYIEPSLIHRVSQELSFMWQMIPVQIWIEVFKEWENHMSQSAIFSRHLNALKENKLEIIKNQLEIHGMEDHLSDSNHLLPIQVLVSIINENINGSEGRMGLRSRHPDGVYWASYSGDFIWGKFNHLPIELRYLIPDGLHSWQKPVAFLPIILGYHSAIGNFISPEEINSELMIGFKLNIDFDRHYFDNVYSIVQGFCYSQKKKKSNV